MDYPLTILMAIEIPNKIAISNIKKLFQMCVNKSGNFFRDVRVFK